MYIYLWFIITCRICKWNKLINDKRYESSIFDIIISQVSIEIKCQMKPILIRLSSQPELNVNTNRSSLSSLFQTSPACASRRRAARLSSPATPGTWHLSVAAAPASSARTRPRGCLSWSKTAVPCHWPTPSANWTLVSHSIWKMW